MSKRLKKTLIIVSALTLPACAVAGGVLQSAYDGEAQKQCEGTQSSQGALDRDARCVDGTYYEKRKFE